MDLPLQVPLNPAERRKLEKCEDVLRKGLGAFFEVGQALLTIRDARLYRDDFPNFEAYCRTRWAMGRHYAWRLMGAAARIKLLPDETGIPRPTTEFQVRPFLSLEPNAFPRAWEQVISQAKGGKITQAVIKGVIQHMPSNVVKPHSMRKQLKVNALPKGCSVGTILILLSQAKKSVEIADIESALATIDRIEFEILGMVKSPA